MKGGGTIYPNKGVKIDPRALTSISMPESLKVYSGYLKYGLRYLLNGGYLTRSDIEKEYYRIQGLRPLQTTKNKLHSSLWLSSETYLIEFFRTSSFNYKIYAFRLDFH